MRLSNEPTAFAAAALLVFVASSLAACGSDGNGDDEPRDATSEYLTTCRSACDAFEDLNQQLCIQSSATRN